MSRNVAAYTWEANMRRNGDAGVLIRYMDLLEKLGSRQAVPFLHIEMRVRFDEATGAKTFFANIDGDWVESTYWAEQ
jgi:hypothetical protein